MTADLVFLENFSNPSAKSVFALAWKNWFSIKRKIYYIDLINRFFTLKEKITYAYAFFNVSEYNSTILC